MAWIKPEIDTALETDSPLVAIPVMFGAACLSLVGLLFIWTAWGRNLIWSIWVEPGIE